MAAKKKTRKKTTLSRKAKKPSRKKTTSTRSKKKVLSIPKGYHSITPYLVVKGAKEAINFYKKAFQAKEVMRLEQGGKIMHAELKIGDAKIMLTDECPEMQMMGPRTTTPSITIHLYVKKVDDTVKKAVASGGKLVEPVENMFWGDRAGKVVDPFGHQWYVSSHVEDVTPREINKRAAALFNKNK